MKPPEDTPTVTVSPLPAAAVPPSPQLDDPRLLAAVEEYLAARQAGSEPERHEFLARYPEIAVTLASCLDGLEFIQAAAPQLRQSAAVLPDARALSEEGIQPEAPLGDYRLVREVGRGGMGVVYEAVQMSLGRRVALKVLPFAATLDAKQLQRFKNEAQAAAHLHHPNIVPVYGVGCERGVHYYAMQFIDGQTVADLIELLRRQAGVNASSSEAAEAFALRTTAIYAPVAAATPPPGASAASTEQSGGGPAFFRTAIGLGIQAAEALEHAHQLGVVHRDIKPANLLVDGRGVLWVTDFGLAQCQTQAGLTITGELVGTLRYMSPEQALARRVATDHRTDVYSLGATLYELLTLQPAFTGGDRGELLRQIAFEEPRPPRRVNPALPAELETIVLKALAKSPDERYATAGELADDLKRFLNDEPIRARPPTLTQRARKWARRHRSLVTCSVAAALAVVAIAVLALAVSYAQINDEQKQTKAALDRETRAKEDLELALYFQRIASAERELASNNPSRAEELLDDCPFELRGWEWHYLKRGRFQPPLVFRGHSNWVMTVAFSPDGKQVASTSPAPQGGLGEIKIWERATGRVIHTLLGHIGPSLGVAFSPDGRRLASAGWDKKVKVWDVTTGDLLQTLSGHREFVVCVAFSPDGGLLASGSADRTMKLWETTGFREVRTLAGHRSAITGLAFSPNGRSLASVSPDRTLRLWETASGKELSDIPAGGTSVAFSPDGRQLATAHADGSVKLWDAPSGRHVRTLRGHMILTTSVAFSSDGRRLASGGWDKTVKVWDLASGQEALTLRGHEDMVTGVAFSSDGLQIASAGLDRTVRVWDAAPQGAHEGPGSLVLRGHLGAVTDLAYRLDGKILASASLDETVKLWDPATGEEIRTLHGHSGYVGGVVFSRDGRRLASSDIFGDIKVWDASNGRELRAFHGYAVHVALSPDGKRLATTREGSRVYVWDAETGAEVLPPFNAQPGNLYCIGFSPDGKRLATAGWGRTTHIWDAATGRQLSVLSGHAHVIFSLAFAPDGKRLATASWDNTARVWDTTTGKELAILRHKDRVLGVAFSPDGKNLATASLDNTAKVWDTATAKELATLSGHNGLVGSVAFSPDGKHLAVGTGHHGKGEITLWDATRWGRKPGEK